MTMNQRLTIIGGETVVWNERTGGFTAFPGGYAMAVESVLPRPAALSDDRVVVAMTRRVYRATLNGQPVESENETFPTMEDALDAISRAITEVLRPLEAAMAEFAIDAGHAAYEDWA
jgi:hypothetical protein